MAAIACMRELNIGGNKKVQRIKERHAKEMRAGN
jgi:hypothetical protein